MNTPNIKERDWVSFLVKPKGGNEFVCNGVVENIKASTFGGRKKGVGATILVSTDEYVRFYGKRRTFISIDKLTKL